MKVNTDGSVLGNHASCSGIFHDHHGTFVGCFSSNLGSFSVFESGLLGFIHAMEIAYNKGWMNLWIEGDSKSTLLVFRNHDLVPWKLRNRWANCVNYDIQLLLSHVFCEGNTCAVQIS